MRQHARKCGTRARRRACRCVGSEGRVWCVGSEDCAYVYDMWVVRTVHVCMGGGSKGRVRVRVRVRTRAIGGMRLRRMRVLFQQPCRYSRACICIVGTRRTNEILCCVPCVYVCGCVCVWCLRFGTCFSAHGARRMPRLL